MPTQIEHVPLREKYQPRSTTTRGISPRNHLTMASSNMVGASIAVQPPPRVRATDILYPPMIATQSVHVEPGAQYFATAVLLDGGGAIVDGLEGTKAAAGFQLDESGGPSTMVYAFSNLSISTAGTYNIRLDLYQMSVDSPAGATLAEQLESNTIAVVNDNVPRQRASSLELALMDRARDAGVPLPSP